MHSDLNGCCFASHSCAHGNDSENAARCSSHIYFLCINLNGLWVTDMVSSYLDICTWINEL